MPDNARRSAVTVIFVHGVSLDPRLFKATAGLLRQRSETWTRPGYGGTPAARSFDEQIERFLDHLDGAGPCVVVGVSGGATLGLAAAIEQPDGLLGLVTHEPLIGSLGPQLDERIARSSAALERDGSPDAINTFLCDVYGDAWNALPDQSAQWSTDHMHHIPADVQQFASFAPRLDDLASVVAHHATTVGSRSLPERRHVAATLSAAGASTTVIADCGHLVLTDNPTSFAATINGVTDVVANRCDGP